MRFNGSFGTHSWEKRPRLDGNRRRLEITTSAPWGLWHFGGYGLGSGVFVVSGTGSRTCGAVGGSVFKLYRVVLGLIRDDQRNRVSKLIFQTPGSSKYTAATKVSSMRGVSGKLGPDEGSSSCNCATSLCTLPRNRGTGPTMAAANLQPPRKVCGLLEHAQTPSEAKSSKLLRRPTCYETGLPSRHARMRKASRASSPCFYRLSWASPVQIDQLRHGQFFKLESLLGSFSIRVPYYILGT